MKGAENVHEATFSEIYRFLLLYKKSLSPFSINQKMKRKSQSTESSKSKKSKFIQNEASESKKASNSKSKDFKKRERIQYIMITARACRYCRVQFKCGHKLEKEAEDCSECNLKHKKCKDNASCTKCCERYRCCTDLKCQQCKDNGIECKRTMPRTQEEYEEIKEKISYIIHQDERTEDGYFHSQVYCQIREPNRPSFKQLHRIFGDDTLHFDIVYGNFNECYYYCAKIYNRCKLHNDPNHGKPCKCDYFDLSKYCSLCSPECEPLYAGIQQI